MQFHKYVASGNDFIIFNCWETMLDLTAGQIKELCDRHTGVGADGVLLLSQAQDHHFRMNYYNADGSRGEMCGNGARTLVHYAFSLNKIPASGTFLADDGSHLYSLDHNKVEVEILVDDQLKEWDLPAPNCGFINTGVPHIIMPVDDAVSVDLDMLGKAMNAHPAHPRGSNLNIVERGVESIRVRTWERGVNTETLACGTGATAVGIYANEVWAEQWPILLSFRGGDLGIDFRRNHYWLSGDTKLVFIGHIKLSIAHNK